MEVRGCFGGLELWGPLSSRAPVFLPPARARQKPAFLGAETLKILIKSSSLRPWESNPHISASGCDPSSMGVPAPREAAAWTFLRGAYRATPLPQERFSETALSKGRFSQDCLFEEALLEKIRPLPRRSARFLATTFLFYLEARFGELHLRKNATVFC